MTYRLKDQKLEVKQDKRFKYCIRIKAYLNGTFLYKADYSKRKNPKHAIQEQEWHLKDDVKFTIQKIREKCHIHYPFIRGYYWKPLIYKIAQNLKEKKGGSNV